MPTSRRRPPLPRRNQRCAAALIEIGLGERKRRVDPQTRRARGRRSARAAPAAVRTVARGAHDGDDLLTFGGSAG
jgi:hypothetical protein